MALITGISGQDGAYLAKFLLNKKYKVVGTTKSLNKKKLTGLIKLNILNKIKIDKMNIKYEKDIKKIFKKYKFDEVYNLAAQSSVSHSFKEPLETFSINAFGVLNILNEIKNKKKIRFYQASSSEIFGNTGKIQQSENTKFNPQSPYANSKLIGHKMTKFFRNTYNLYAVSGIMFNHESSLRSNKFISKKIVNGLVKVSRNKIKNIELGNIYVKRDWGYSKEYVEVMWKMLQQKKPSDYVIATGKSYTVKEFVNETAKSLKLHTKWTGKGENEKLIDKNNNKLIIKINKKLYRSSDVYNTRGNISKAMKNLKWKPKTTFSKLIKILVKDEIDRVD